MTLICPETVPPFQANISAECVRIGRLIASNEVNLTEASPEFPFEWGDCWHFAVEYNVNDFSAELGFFVHFMGFSLNALSRGYAMLMSPGEDVFIAIRSVDRDATACGVDSFRICFMLKDVLAAVSKMEQRGIALDTAPQPLSDVDHPMYRADLMSPNGLKIELWGFGGRQR